MVNRPSPFFNPKSIYIALGGKDVHKGSNVNTNGRRSASLQPLSSSPPGLLHAGR